MLRDPRDVALSWDNHVANINVGALLSAREQAVGNDDLADYVARRPLVAHEDELDCFWAWVDANEVHEGNAGLARLVHHATTVWGARDEPNVVLLRYSDLTADLDGQMRALAERLAIDVPEDRWPELVAAARFEAMRSSATTAAPDMSHGLWKDPAEFFHRGGVGHGEAMLGPEGNARYLARVATLADPEVISWLHHR